jgi:predicted Zn-dependent peptidase
MILPNVHAYTVEKLPDGLTLVYEKYNDSNVVVVDFWVKTGSLYENDKNNGASHFMEHMFFQGTKKRPGNTADYIKEIGATYNGATSQDFVHYFIEAPKEKLAESIDIIADMLGNAEITEKKFNEEKGVILAELASRQSEPMTYLYDTFGSVIFNHDYPYSRPIGGNYDVIKKMTIDDLKYFYDHFYTKDRIVVVITGNFDEKTLPSLVEEKAKDIKVAEKPIELKFEKPDPLKETKNISVKRQTQGLSYNRIGWIGVDALNPDFPALYMLASILSGSDSARLDQKIVTTGLASSISMDFSETKLTSDFSFTYITIPENIEKVKGLILDEIKDISKGNVSDEEINRMKVTYESRFEMGKERPISLASNLGFYWTVANLDLYDNLLKKIKGVKKDDIVRVCKKYLQNKNYAFYSLLPEE